MRRTCFLLRHLHSSIQDIYIKQEQAEAKNNDVLILSDIDNMTGMNMSSDGVQEYHLADVGDDIISSSNNICMNMAAIQVRLSTRFICFRRFLALIFVLKRTFSNI